MKDNNAYFETNRLNWNKRTTLHVKSEFYQYEQFVEGASSLNPIELDLLSDVKDQSLLHLQCHFGQDTISWQRLGAHATGVDLSDESIKQARILNERCGTGAEFIRSNVYEVSDILLDKQFDIVYTSYGTIGWLPDLNKWAKVVSRHLKPDGTFLIVDFHPMIWMYDNDLSKITYSYFNREVIIEEEEGSYADQASSEIIQSIGWNHSTADLINALIDHGLTIESFDEFDYSPYQVFPGMVEISPNKYHVEKWAGMMPLIYALKAKK